MRRSTSPTGPWARLRSVGDLAVALLAFLGAFEARILFPIPFTQGLLPADRLQLFSSEWLVIAASQPLMLYFFGFYDSHEPASRPELNRRLATACSFQLLLLMGYFFLLNRTFPRSVLVLFFVFNLLLLVGWRNLILRLGHPDLRRVVIVGTGAAALELAETIRDHPWYGLTVVGHLAAPGEEGAFEELARANPQAQELLGEALGGVEDLPALFDQGAADDVILAGSGYPWQTRLIDQLAAGGTGRANVLMLPGPFESLIGRMRYRWVRDLPLIEVLRQNEWRVSRRAKRALDLVVGCVLLALAAVPLGLCALLVAATSHGPVFYRQTRIGADQRPFEVWKLRTMHLDAEQGLGEVLAEPNDPRLTPVGGLLRSFRLDELPQLFQVLSGSMSMVGPRPERPSFVARYLEEVPGYAERFSLPPGLTGLAQVNGDYHSSAQNKLRYDLAYIANWSFWLDLSILFRTVKIVLTSRGT